MMSKTTEIQGAHSTATVFTQNIEDDTIDQIRTLCDQEFTKESKIRIMPDVHIGMGCTIGTTMTIKDKVVPNLVGVDIGCGVEVVKLKNTHIELEKLDKLIYDKIPSGFNIRKKEHHYNDQINLDELRCKKKVNLNRAKLSIGTLGGGNHFIEANKDSEGNIYLVVHSGSRNIGNEVAKHYQKEASKTVEEGIPKTLAYLEGPLFDDYIHDMKVIQAYATLNRKAIIHEIVKGMNLKVEETFTTIHNYIDTEDMILRKGAVSSKKDEVFLIPINMRDGSLICKGKGNPDWNYSAPHGAGRLMSRSVAKSTLTLTEFKKTMKGIYSTSINTRTLDECPHAYKSMDEIVNNTEGTLEILDHIKPIYNFKG